MSHVHNAMVDAPSELDDVRYEHHLKHRGRANHRIFWTVWLAIAAALLVIVGYRMYRWGGNRFHRTHRYQRIQKQVDNSVFDRARSLCGAFALLRSFKSFAFGLPAGKLVLLTSYVLLVTLLLLAADAPLKSPHFLDDVAFRAAWLTLTQLPLVYLLSAKRGPLNFIAGLSHERFNYIHRCVARMLFLCATVHAMIMKSSISAADIFHSKEQGMNIVRYGIGAYATLVWIVVSSIMPLRRWSYRVFYANHYFSTIGLLVLAFQHVPTYARPSIYLATSIVALDKISVAYLFIRNNISLSPPLRRFAKFRRGPGRGRLIMGYPVKLSAPSASAASLPSQTKETTTIFRLANIPFTWKAGQHIRLYMPILGRWEMHPFTPANCSVVQPPPLPPRKDVETGASRDAPKQTSEMLLIVKSKSGFTTRLVEHHRTWLRTPCPNATHPPPEELTAYIDGPYSTTPSWESYESLVLIASSTGVSFTLSILNYVEQLSFLGPEEMKTRHVEFVWVMRHTDPALEDTAAEMLKTCGKGLREAGIRMDVVFYTTCPESLIKEDSEPMQPDVFAHLRPRSMRQVSSKPELRIRHPDEIVEEWTQEAAKGSEESDPFMEWDEYASPDSDESENNTLVNGQDQRKSGDEVEWMEHVEDDEGGDDWVEEGRREDNIWRPLPVSESESSPEVEGQADGCQCGLIQHQRQKLRHTSAFSSRVHGARPNMRELLSGITDEGTTMIAMCANTGIAQDVRAAVAQLKMSYALSHRKGKVDLWTENQI